MLLNFFYTNPDKFLSIIRKQIKTDSGKRTQMKQLSNMGLKGKMICGILVFIAINAAISAFGVSGLNTVTATYDHVATINLPNSEALSGMLNEQKDIMSYMQQFEALTAGSPEADAIVKKVEESIASYEKTDKWYQDIPFVEGEDALYKAASGSWADFKKEVQAVLAKKKTDAKEANADVAKLFELSKTFDTKLGNLVTFQGSQAKTWRDNADAVSKRTFLVQNILVVVSAIFSLMLGLWFARSLTKQLNHVVESISESSRQVGTAATQIAASSQQLSQATTEQAASLQETSSAIEETSAMVNKNSDNAKSAATNSAECQQKAEQGKEVVEKMIQSMDEINASNNNIMTQINTSNDQISEIVKVIQEIGTKTKVINEIVFQTKLLSFNASVEAARAGENGKGFAVVAEEVGNLAQMSGNASKEITTLLDGSIQKVESIVNETKSKVEILIADGRNKVEAGIDIAKQCGDVLNDIVQNVARVSHMAGEISSACQDQAVGVQEITKAVNQLDQTTQINASNSEETANAADHLSTQTTALNEAINSLVHTIQGNNSNHSPSSQPVTALKSHAPTKHFTKTKSSTPVKPEAKKAQVISLAKASKKKVEADSDPVPTNPTMHVNTTPFKSAVGDGNAPSHNHPGFKEV